MGFFFFSHMSAGDLAHSEFGRKGNRFAVKKF